MAVDPMVCLLVLLLWLACFLTTKISSASALFAFAMMPFIFFFKTNNKYLLMFGILLSLIIFVTHFKNIQRLLAGKEKKFNI